MRNLQRIAVFTAFGLSMAGFALAQGAPAPATPPAHPVFRHRLRECLSILDLSDAQKAQIQGILEAAAPAIQADVDAVKMARETLKAALEANPPDACAIGADALALKSARETLHAERESVLQQVEATLSPDQVARLEGCLAAPWRDAAAGGSPDAPPAE